MFLYFFSIAIIVTSIITIKKHCYIAFFLPMMLFLPDYYGIDINYSLPILTVKRILFLVLYIYVFSEHFRKKGNPQISKHLTAVEILVVLHFLTRIISNMYYISTYSQAVKTILQIITEQALLLVALRIAALSKEQYITIIKVVVWASVVMSVLGLFESFTGYRLTDSLYTVKRYMLNDHYIRSGLLRSTVSLGLPNIYGNYCVLAIPLIMFLYEHTRSKLYFVAAFLDIFACIHSGSRASLLFVFATVFLAIAIHFKNKRRLLEYFKNVSIVTLSLCLVIVALSLTGPKIRYYYVSSGKAVLNTFGFDFDLNEGAPEGSEGYGSNPNGVLSRTAQFSGIQYVAQTNPIFGLGSGAQLRGEIKYYRHGQWRASHSYDVGYVELFANEGALGWFSIILLYVSFFLTILHRLKISDKDKLSKYLLLGIVSYAICMFSSVNLWHYLFFYGILIFFPASNTYTDM